MTVLLRSTLQPIDITTEILNRFDIFREEKNMPPKVVEQIEAVITTGGLGLSADKMREFPNLKMISVYGVGTDGIDLAQCKERGIQVATTPGVLTNAVAEMALALTLGACRRIAEGDRYVRAGKWPQGNLAIGWSLVGQTVGVLGYGRIGKRIGELCRAVGMNVIYTDLMPTEGEEEAFRATPELLAEESRVLIIAAVGGEKTRGLVNRSVLKKLGPDGLLVNVARGTVVNQTELIESLYAGELGCAALDVYEKEPHVPAELIANEKLVLTPHVASATIDARRAMGRLVIDNLAAFLDGKPLVTPLPL